MTGRSRSARSSPRSRRGARSRPRCCWSVRPPTTTRCAPRWVARANPGPRIGRSPPMCGCTISPAGRMWSFPRRRRARCRPVASIGPPISRALLLRLDAWVSHNAEPPASELMPLEPASGEPPALRAPTRLSAAVIQVPKRDQDGNALGGVRLPDIAVPTGTNGGQNQPQTFTCMLVGSFTPFAATKVGTRTHGRPPPVDRGALSRPRRLREPGPDRRGGPRGARVSCCRKMRR